MIPEISATQLLHTPPFIAFPQPQHIGWFIKRLNRFAVLVDLDEGIVQAHLPNSGRMTELLVEGHKVVLIPMVGALRKPHFDMVLVEYQGHWVSVDSRIPSALAHTAFVQQAIPSWATFTDVRREVVYGESRLDIELRSDNRRALIETKSVNLVEDGIALFPDAPTTRGQRHLRELIRAVEEGIPAGVLFIIQRNDARVFRPFDAADPEFGRWLRIAAKAGVAVEAYGCSVTPEVMVLDAQVPVEL